MSENVEESKKKAEVLLNVLVRIPVIGGLASALLIIQYVHDTTRIILSLIALTCYITPFLFLSLKAKATSNPNFLKVLKYYISINIIMSLSIFILGLLSSGNILSIPFSLFDIFALLAINEVNKRLSQINPEFKEDKSLIKKPSIFAGIFYIAYLVISLVLIFVKF